MDLPEVDKPENHTPCLTIYNLPPSKRRQLWRFWLKAIMMIWAELPRELPG
jgi:hypothetical protein